MDYKHLGNRIREERILNRMTQACLAEKSEISTNFLGQIERGEKIPSLETIIKISKSLNVTIDSLIRNVNLLDDKLITSELLLALSKINRNEKALLLNIIRCFSCNYSSVNHYEVINNDDTNDIFVIKDTNGMREFEGLVITDNIKQELNKIGVIDVEYIPMYSINRTTNEVINNLWKVNVKRLVYFESKLDPNKIPDNFDICSDCKTLRRIFISERVKDIFLKNGLTKYKYIKLQKNNQSSNKLDYSNN